MPTGLKLFFILCAGIAAVFAWRAAAILWFPSPEHLAQLAHVPDSYRALAAAGDQFTAALWALQAAVLLAFGALIVFGRLGWMRHMLALLIAFQYGVPAAITLTQSHLSWPMRWDLYIQTWWHSPASLIWLGVWIALIVTMFLPGNKRWYARRPAA